VICDSVAEIAGRPGVTIDAADWQKLNRALDVTIAHAVSSYEALRRDEERRCSAAELGSIAHELRNALAAASVAFEVVKRGRVGAGSRTAEIVTRNLKRGGAPRPRPRRPEQGRGAPGAGPRVVCTSRNRGGCRVQRPQVLASRQRFG
jgi:hypothetical protein